MFRPTVVIVIISNIIIFRFIFFNHECPVSVGRTQRKYTGPCLQICFKILPLIPWVRFTSTILLPTALTILKGLPFSLLANSAANSFLTWDDVISFVILNAVETNPRTYKSSRVRPCGTECILGFGSKIASLMTAGPVLFFFDCPLA